MSERERFSPRDTQRRMRVVVVSQEHDAGAACRELEDVLHHAVEVDVLFADSIDTAQNLIRCESPDWVLVDTRLIGGSPQGIEFEGWLSDHAATKGLHVIWCRRGD